MDKILMSGSIGMLILKLLEEKDMYGYEMIEKLREKSDTTFELKAGTLYPLLHNFEKQDLVKSYEGSGAGNRIRKYYSITKKGRGVLEEKKNEWYKFYSSVNAVLGEEKPVQESVKCYINTVKEQVRWKLSHSEIEKELTDHITDQAEEYMYKGFSEDAAYDRAVQEMGDPYMAGSEFDSVYKPEIKWQYIIFAAVFVGIGFILNYTIAVYRGTEINSLSVFMDIMNVLLGIVCLYIGYKLDFTGFMKHTVPVFAVILLIFYMVYPFAIEVNGSRAWIDIPLLGRSDITKLLLLFPLIFSGIIYEMRNKGILAYSVCGVAYMTTVFILSWNIRIGMLFVITLMTLPVMVYAVHKNWFSKSRYLKYLFYILCTCGIAFSLYLFVFNRFYSIEVIKGAFWPRDTAGFGYRSISVREILASSGVVGTAPGGMDIGNKLASYYSEFKLVFAAQKAGIIVFFMIIALIVLFTAGLYKSCFKQKSFAGKITALAVVNTFALQFLFYIMMNTGIYLVTVSLPFVEYRGIDFLINMFLLGILLSVFSCEKLIFTERAGKEPMNEKRFLQYESKKLIVDFNYFARNVK